MEKKNALIIGGLVLAGLAAFFLLNKSEVPTGGSAYGPSSGYEGGGAGTEWLPLLLGGETINFPPPAQIDISGLLPPPPANQDGDLRYAKGGDVIGGIRLKDPYVTSVPVAGQVSGGAKKESSDGGLDILGGLVSIFGGAFSVATAPARSVAGGLGALSSIAGGRSGGISGGISGESTIAAKKPYVSTPPGATVTSYQSGGSGNVASYVQSKYGQPGSGYVVRGYSLTGVPLYKAG